MKDNHIIGMIWGYYLSRFDKDAYKRLGFRSNSKEAHRTLGKELGVSANSIKNWRDEFDPIHDNPRKGWHKREMRPTQCRILEALESLSEAELFAFLKNAVGSPEGKVAQALIRSVLEADTDAKERAFGARGITGKKAEESFINFHRKKKRPAEGKLTDRRYDGCGYDFLITNREKEVAVEVKGLAYLKGGILFTDKEWSTAQDMGGSYYLVVVRNVIIEEPVFSYVQNPAAHLEPQLHTYTTFHGSYSVTERILSNAEKDMTD